MGRKRLKDYNLPPRMYRHRRNYRYHPRYGAPISLGPDLAAAKRRWAELEQPATEIGTVAALLNKYLAEVAVKKAPRTYRDNIKEAAKLTAALGHIPYSELRPTHVAQYLEARATEGGPVRGNREKALLSHTYSKAMRWGMVDSNPCKGVARNRETPRERYVTHEEFHTVYQASSEPVQYMMKLIYLTCQRPDDLLGLTLSNLLTQTVDGVTVETLRLRQSKTGKLLDLRIVGPLAELVATLKTYAKKRRSTLLLPNRWGARYSESGMSGMFRKIVSKQGLKDFTLYDLKAKALTDLDRHGTRREQLQKLAGHASLKTTEIYLKRHGIDLVEANCLPLPAPTDTATEEADSGK